MRPNDLLALAGVLLGLSAPVAWAPAAWAQDRDFCADRPGKGSPACVLDAGRFQAEAAALDASFSRGGGTSEDAYAVGGLELRAGLTSRLEAQATWTPYTHVRDTDRATGARSTVQGVGDLGLALRYSLRNPGGDGLAVALEPFVTAPTGHSGIGAGVWQGGLTVPVSVALANDWSLGLAPTLASAADADGQGSHLSWSGAAGLSRPVGEFSLGGELWAQVDDDPAGRTTSASFDLFGAWTPKALHDVQFDLGVDLGLNANTPDLEIVAGVAHRF